MYVVSSSFFNDLPTPFIIFGREEDALKFCRDISNHLGDIDDIFIDENSRMIYRINKIVLPIFNHSHLTRGEIQNEYSSLYEAETQALTNLSENNQTSPPPLYQSPAPAYNTVQTNSIRSPAPSYRNVENPFEINQSSPQTPSRNSIEGRYGNLI